MGSVLETRRCHASSRRSSPLLSTCDRGECTHGQKAERKLRGPAGIRPENRQAYFRRMTWRESHPRQELAMQNAAGVLARTSATRFAFLLRYLLAKSDA
jgi:hypothetical protein